CNACSSPQLEKKLVEFRQDILTTFFLRLLMRGLETCACGIPPFRLKSCISEVCPQSLAPVGAPVGAAATRSRIFATPASAQTWSLAPPGAPPTPSAATISPLCLIATPPSNAKTLGIDVSAGPGPAGFLASSAI